MTTTPGSGWPAGPPPQGPGPNQPWGVPPWPPNSAPLNSAPPAAGYPPPDAQRYPAQQPPGYPPSGYPANAGPQPGSQTPAGFDPRRALGEQPPAHVSIGEFAPPSNRTPLLITIAALVTLVLVIAGGLYVRSLPAAQPSTSASPTPASTSTGPGHPFNTPDDRQKGRWEILSSNWIDEGLIVELGIYSDDGSISFSFMAFSNASAEVVSPASSPREPDIRRGTASPARPSTGYVFFPMSRGDATIILANGAGRQMSALAVKG